MGAQVASPDAVLPILGKIGYRRKRSFQKYDVGSRYRSLKTTDDTLAALGVDVNGDVAEQMVRVLLIHETAFDCGCGDR